MNALSTPITRAAGRSEKAALWRGCALTAVAAVLFPRLNAVLHEGQAIYQLDTEAAIGIPALLVATPLLFATLGSWAWRGSPAKPALVCAVLAIVGVVAFFVSAPIVLGGLAVTLGLEARRRAGGNHAAAAVVIGGLAVLAGAVIWLVA